MIETENSISETFHQILAQLKMQEARLSQGSPSIYDNKAIMALIGIKDRYLKRLQDNDLIGYSRHSDKYW